MGLLQLVLTGIASDLGVEDGQAGVKRGYMGAHLASMFDKELIAFGLRAGASFAQVGVSHHVADWHAGRFQAADKLDPRQNASVVFPLARTPRGARQQPDPFIISDRVGCQASALGEVADLHAWSRFVVMLKLLRVRAHSKSRRIGTGLGELR
jgi:hypothetical protein